MRPPLWMRAVRLTAGLGAVMIAAIALVGVWRTVPGGDNPFTPFNVDDPPGLFTDDKIAALARHPDTCREALARAGVAFSPIKDRTEGEFCALKDAVALTRTSVPYSGPVRVSCPMAAAIALWEREVLQPAAEEVLGRKVARVEHVGAYACRRVYGGRTGDPSQHATANAIDVIGFTLDDGRVVSVAKDWGADTDEAKFLALVHKRSCGVFRGVLGPRYNDYHADHFHMDLGPYDLCR